MRDLRPDPRRTLKRLALALVALIVCLQLGIVLWGRPGPDHHDRESVHGEVKSDSRLGSPSISLPRSSDGRPHINVRTMSIKPCFAYRNVTLATLR